MGIPEKEKYVEEETKKEPEEIDKIIAFEMKLKRISIRKINEEGNKYSLGMWRT